MIGSGSSGFRQTLVSNNEYREKSARNRIEALKGKWLNDAADHNHTNIWWNSSNGGEYGRKIVFVVGTAVGE